MRLAAAALSLLALPAAAQGGTDIWLVPLTGTMRSPSVGAAVNVTNRPGYDNQPSFAPDGRTMYFTAQHDGQTDIYRYDLASRTSTQVTRTPESEYSALTTPDGRGFSVVRVEKDSAQRLWRFAPDGTPEAPLIPAIKPVGYHAWLNADTVFIYLLGGRGTPATLQRVSVASGAATEIARNIGRTIVRASDGTAIYYAVRDTSGWWVHAYDVGQDQAVVKLPSRRDDFFAVTQDGDIIAPNGNTLLYYHRADQVWTQLARFTEPGLQHITRIAINPAGDQIALVGDEAN